MGEKGQPREWIYTWYAKDGVPPIREFVTTKEYKLYRNGRFYDLKKDPFEDKEPMRITELTGDEAKTAAKLKAVLAQYSNARPPAIASKSNEAKQAPKDTSQKAASRARKAARNTSDE
jgi:arylsulfatase A